MRLVFILVLVAAVVPAAALASKSAVTKVSATLTSAAVAPKSKTMGKGTGTISVKLDAKAGKACWTILLKRAGTPLSAHIHRGLAGKTGPVVIPLGDRWSKTGCVFVSPKTLNAVAKSPKSYYVDVHTRAFVNGFVRGQLRPGA
jgi:hypothetical protein